MSSPPTDARPAVPAGRLQHPLPEGSVIRFTSELVFSNDDLRRFPWLKNVDRSYFISRKLGDGGFAVAYLGCPCDSIGNRVADHDVVIKFPKLGGVDVYRERDREKRLNDIQRQARVERRHVRKRLEGCPHANVIFDMHLRFTEEGTEAITAQLYLPADEYLSLDKWLVLKSFRPALQRDDSGGTVDNWMGTSAPEDWHAAVTPIAKALSTVHSRRVIHGDIWPDNIYVSLEHSDLVTFIDFGQSRLFAPISFFESETPHPYLAPERRISGCAVTEQADVYSFGMVALHVATGRVIGVPEDVRSHARRRWIRDYLLKRNRPLVLRCPEVLDVITRCVAFDPVDRPSMQSVCEELRRFGRVAVEHSEHLRKMKDRGVRIIMKYEKKFSSGREVVRQLVDRKIAELESLLDTLESEMVEVEGNRDYLISVLVSLFDELQSGDTWASLTTPSAWHADALGSDGRYLTATLLAVRRGVAVSRGLVVAVEDLGAQWVSELARQLRIKSSSAQVSDVAGHLEAGVRAYEQRAQDIASRRVSATRQHEQRKRFTRWLTSFRDLVDIWELKERVALGRFLGVKQARGLFCGLIMCPTVDEAAHVRQMNPAAVVYRAQARKSEEQWMLIRVDISSRLQTFDQPDAGVIRKVRVYHSVDGVPEDRIIELDRALRSEATNVGGCIAVVADTAEELYARGGD